MYCPDVLTALTAQAAGILCPLGPLLFQCQTTPSLAKPHLRKCITWHVAFVGGRHVMLAWKISLWVSNHKLHVLLCMPQSTSQLEALCFWRCLFVYIYIHVCVKEAKEPEPHSNESGMDLFQIKRLTGRVFSNSENLSKNCQDHDMANMGRSILEP